MTFLWGSWKTLGFEYWSAAPWAISLHLREDKHFFGLSITSILQNFKKRTRSRDETQLILLLLFNYLKICAAYESLLENHENGNLDTNCNVQ